MIPHLLFTVCTEMHQCLQKYAFKYDAGSVLSLAIYCSNPLGIGFQWISMDSNRKSAVFHDGTPGTSMNPRKFSMSRIVCACVHVSHCMCVRACACVHACVHVFMYDWSVGRGLGWENMYAMACDGNTTAMGPCCAVMHAQYHGLCVYIVYLVCVWREVYIWVYAWCEEHQYGLTRVCTCVCCQF